jgi:hypothetical protein
MKGKYMSAVETVNNVLSKLDLSSLGAKLNEAGKLDETTVKAITGLFTTAEESLSDGFQFSDAIKILAAGAATLVPMARELISSGTGEAKKKFVVTILTELYQFIDKGADGTKNRICLSKWLPTSVENYIESTILPFLISMAIEASYAMLKSKISA